MRLTKPIKSESAGTQTANRLHACVSTARDGGKSVASVLLVCGNAVAIGWCGKSVAGMWQVWQARGNSDTPSRLGALGARSEAISHRRNVRKDAPWTPLLDVASAPFEVRLLLGRGLPAGLGDVFLEGFAVELRPAAEVLGPVDYGRSGVEERTLSPRFPLKFP